MVAKIKEWLVQMSLYKGHISGNKANMQAIINNTFIKSNGAFAK